MKRTIPMVCTLLVITGSLAGLSAAQADAPSDPDPIADKSGSDPVELRITLLPGGDSLAQAGKVTITEQQGGGLTIIGDGVFLQAEELDGHARGSYHYEISSPSQPNLNSVHGPNGDWVIIGDTPIQVLVLTEEMPNEDGWQFSARDLLSGETVIVFGGADSGRDEMGDGAFIEAVATVLTMQMATGGCDPDFKNCTGAAENACEPDRYQVTYHCNPETGEVTCEWTCHPIGGGGTGGN